MMLVAPDATLNVFCLSASLSLRLSVCDLQTLVWVFNLLPSVTCLPHPSHSLTAPRTRLPLTTSSLGYLILLHCLPVPIIFTPPPHSLPHCCFPLLPSFPTCPVSPFVSSPLWIPPTSLYPLPAQKRNTISKPSFSLFPWTPPQSFLDENAGHVHGTQARGDRDWPSGGMRWRLTAMFNIHTPQLYLYINAFICDIFLELDELSWPQHLKTHTHTQSFHSALSWLPVVKQSLPALVINHVASSRGSWHSLPCRS